MVLGSLSWHHVGPWVPSVWKALASVCSQRSHSSERKNEILYSKYILGLRGQQEGEGEVVCVSVWYFATTQKLGPLQSFFFCEDSWCGRARLLVRMCPLSLNIWKNCQVAGIRASETKGGMKVDRHLQVPQ